MAIANHPYNLPLLNSLCFCLHGSLSSESSGSSSTALVVPSHWVKTALPGLGSAYTVPAQMMDGYDGHVFVVFLTNYNIPFSLPPSITISIFIDLYLSAGSSLKLDEGVHNGGNLV